MSNPLEALPLADAGREAFAREQFPVNEPVGKYAAQNAHGWGGFSFADYRYGDEALTAWVQALGDILFQRNGAPSIEQLREQHLSREERRQIACVEAKQRNSGDL